MTKNLKQGCRFYRYDPDANAFASIGASSEEDVVPIHSTDDSLLGAWKPIIFHGYDDNPPREGDFPSLNDFYRIPVASNRAWQAIEPLVGYCCEALPISHPSGNPYFIIHVMDTIDCLDEDASELTRRFDGRVYDIDRYAFKRDCVSGKHIFKLPRKSGGELIVDDDFRRVVEENGLKGLRFQELPMV